ncbi:MAG TPA: peptidase S10, partial [Hyphomicrobiaceae bacterium]|nr:peptidase S10 [Hyphomicrobiaceae bacterium]
DRQEKARPAALLPPPSRTEHALELAGRTIRFTATAGAIPISNSAGRTLAEIAYVAYTLDGADPRRRPVTFAFNGGPGAASAWLHIGAMGPWRLPLAAASAAPSAPPALVPNAETWLDFTDLVFIDPVGSGYSHLLGESGDAAGRSAKRGSRRSAPEPASREEGGPRYFWSIDGDVESLADFIQEWLKRADRLASPKMLVGESYGGFRAPKIVHLLQRQRGIAVNAMVLVSPVLDFEGRRLARHSPSSYANLLPSLAAAALERQGTVPTRELLSEVEAYARSAYLVDLLRGPRDQAAVDRIVTKVAEFTRLPEEAVRRHGGRLSSRAYVQEAVRPKQRVASFYDVSVTGLDPDPGSASTRFDDPFTTALAAPMTGAMGELLNKRLQWRTGRTYHLLSRRANRAWIWGNSPHPPEAISALKEVLSLDARFQVLVAHGFTDLVTPYTASTILIDQLPAYGDPARVSSEVYPGGHMFYSRDGSRAAFRRDAEKLLARSLQPQGT